LGFNDSIISPLRRFVKNEKTLCPKSKAFFVGSSIRLYIEDLFAIVEAANLANAVVLNECVARRVGTLVHAGQRELAVVGTSLVSASFGNFFLWYCHA
jgi:hypothetical protein